MRMYDLIMKKRDGYELSKEEIDYIVEEYTKGDIPDYQMSAFLMSVYFQGMNENETLYLTEAMADSGDRLDLSNIEGVKVDKHSTGGVGDKTTLIVGPILASLGVPIAKMSGRGLGHTGGTIDKLESIPGFSTTLSEKRFIDNVNKVKLAVVGQTANLAPADKKIYALRDVTATVDNYSLIAASIMSKKLAAGADVIVLDVKTGSGAFMKNEEDAVKLAKTMVSIGTLAGKKTYALITDMNEPLGKCVGNGLEVMEAIEVLKGGGNSRLVDICIELATYMIIGAGLEEDIDKARAMARDSISTGKAYDKFLEFITAQGADAAAIESSSNLVSADYIEKIYLPEEGYITSCNTSEVGMTSLILGGGRETKDSVIDLSVGIVIEKTIGDYIKKDEPIAYIFANNKEKLEQAKDRLIGAYTVSDKIKPKAPMVKRIITDKDLD